MFPAPGEILADVDQAVGEITGTKFDSRRIFKDLVAEAFDGIAAPGPGHKNVVNTTNISHLRGKFVDQVKRDHGKAAGVAADVAIRRNITCYAATLHSMRGQNITDPVRKWNKGHAPMFECVTQFPGRSADAAELDDLLGRSNPKTPWKERLPRLIFVSDMGDALSAKGDLPFLKTDLMPAIRSEAGKRHLWLWLTKRPDRMAEFANTVGGFPSNVCAMTTVTSMATLDRINQIRQVKAAIRGLSIEPLWERIPPNKLNLKGIDWVIVGGESGPGALTRPFALEWAEELRDHCRDQGVAFFLKQLGRNPSRDGKVFRLKNLHGGDWDEWDESLRVREFPQAFHDYRSSQIVVSGSPRPIVVRKPKKSMDSAAELMTPEDKAEFKRLDKMVRKGVAAFMESGEALMKIQERKLWKAGGYTTWEDYCREVAGVSKSYASRLVQAVRIAICLREELPIGNSGEVIEPRSEFQIRPLLRLDDPAQQRLAWKTASEKAGGQPTEMGVREAVFEIKEPENPPENRQTRSQQRLAIIDRLKKTIQKRKSWEQVEKLLQELEELM